MSEDQDRREDRVISSLTRAVTLVDCSDGEGLLTTRPSMTTLQQPWRRLYCRFTGLALM